jgi:hypothetical protein
MGAIPVKAPSTRGTRSRLARAQPRAGTVDQGRFTPRPRVSSSNGCTFDSPEAQLGQASRRSNLGRIATPTGCIAGALNASVAWHLILTHAPQSTRPKWPQSLRSSTGWPDRKTAPPVLLRLLCHPSGWGWQPPRPVSSAIGSSASPDPRARTPPRPRKTDSASLDPWARTQSRPQKMVSASPDPRARTQHRLRKAVSASPDPWARTQPWLRKAVSASPDPWARTQPRPRKAVSASPDLWGSDSTSTSDDGLRLTRPLGLGLNLDLGRRSPPRPTPGARTQPRPRTTVSASPDPQARTQPRPRRSLRLAQPRARTDHVTGRAIITLPLASSGYGEQDRRPIWLAPVNK